MEPSTGLKGGTTERVKGSPLSDMPLPANLTGGDGVSKIVRPSAFEIHDPQAYPFTILLCLLLEATG